MTTTPYDAEFRRYVDSKTVGLRPIDRLDVLRTMRADLEREGLVPVRGNLISVSPDLRTPSWSTHTQATSPATNIRNVRGVGLKVGALLCCIIAMIVLWGAPSSRDPAALPVPSALVTAQDGPTAPTSLILGEPTAGERTLHVRSFDPTLGWPDVTEFSETAFWGKTTINIVLAVDGEAFEDELDALQPGTTITVRQAQGQRVPYRVIEQLVADAAANEHAAQNRVGLTIVGMLDGRERRIIHALPADVPIPIVDLGGLRVEAGQPVWEQPDAQDLTLAVTLSLQISRHSNAEALPTGSITLQAGQFQEQLDVGVLQPDQPTSAVLRIPAPEQGQDQVDIAVALENGRRGTVSVAVPSRPTAIVSWGAASYKNTTVSVSFTIETDGPVKLTAQAFTCRLSGAAIPMTLDGLSLPSVINGRTEVTGHCSVALQRGQQLEITVLDTPAVVAVP